MGLKSAVYNQERVIMARLRVIGPRNREDSYSELDPVSNTKWFDQKSYFSYNQQRFDSNAFFRILYTYRMTWIKWATHLKFLFGFTGKIFRALKRWLNRNWSNVRLGHDPGVTNYCLRTVMSEQNLQSCLKLRHSQNIFVKYWKS